LANNDGSPNGSAIKNTTTSNGGNYNFTGICEGNYVLQFETIGNYKRTVKKNNITKDNLDSDANTLTGFTDLISIAVGENDVSNQSGYYLPGAIQGNVFLDINGNNQKSGADVNLPDINISLTGTTGFGQAFSLNLQTTNLGSYNFDNLVPGNYILKINTTQPNAKSNVASTYLPSATSTFNITVVSNEIALVYNLGLFAPVSISNFVWNDLDKNGLFDTGEPKMPNVSVKLNGIEGDGIVVPQIEVFTDMNGNYSFNQLSPGNYSLLFATPSGYIPTQSNFGTNENIDSDPINGLVSNILVVSGDAVQNISAGFQPAAALSVTLLNFNGQALGQKAKLNWKVSDEKDFSNYEIQKSYNLKEFSTIGKIIGQNKQQYSFDDNNTENKVNYYRLKMIDNDGSFNYSKVISLDFRKENLFVQTENPIMNATFNLFTNAKASNIEILTLLGSPVKFNISEINKNTFKISILSPITSGIYFVKVNNGYTQITRKVIIE
jgi:hypothetical protein